MTGKSNILQFLLKQGKTIWQICFGENYGDISPYFRVVSPTLCCVSGIGTEGKSPNGIQTPLISCCVAGAGISEKAYQDTDGINTLYTLAKTNKKR